MKEIRTVYLTNTNGVLDKSQLSTSDLINIATRTGLPNTAPEDGGLSRMSGRQTLGTKNRRRPGTLESVPSLALPRCIEME
jgi:hypothetical protein